MTILKMTGRHAYKVLLFENRIAKTNFLLFANTVMYGDGQDQVD
jgi:hypothetical protein